jgi:hypothetical protein
LRPVANAAKGRRYALLPAQAGIWSAASQDRGSVTYRGGEYLDVSGPI